MRRAQIEQNTILLCKSGSHAYGLATEASDVDYKGVFIASPEYFYGFRTIEQKDGGGQDGNDPESGLFPFLSNQSTQVDCVIYEVRKYIQLLLNNNPNILEMLFQPEESIIYSTSLAQKLIDTRYSFLSKKVKYSLAGYAYSQLKRIETHRSWLLNPPSAPPKLEDYGLTNEWKAVAKSEINAFLEFLYILVKDRLEYLETIDQIKELYYQIDLKQVLKSGKFIENPETLDFACGITRCSKEFLHLLHQTHLYQRDLKYWNSFVEWKTKRNPKRAEMEAKCNFDAKHASHAVRLLRMGVEALDNCDLYVDRTNIDRDYLLSIKLGNEKYEDVMEVCDKLFEQLEEKYNTSKLRRAPDTKKAEEICVEIVTEFLNDS
jgi:predicted nucleotidyltransferase